MAVDKTFNGSLEQVRDYIRNGQLDEARVAFENSQYFGERPSRLALIFDAMTLYFGKLQETREALNGRRGFFGNGGSDQKKALEAINDALKSLKRLGNSMKNVIADKRI